MASLNDVTAFLDEILEIEKYQADYSNNGLQFRGAPEIRKAAFAVDACAASFTAASDIDADILFVHHGISWSNGFKRIDGLLADRIKLLAANDMSLYAAHLPLDANEIFGHNALIGGMLDLKDMKPFGLYHGFRIGFEGRLAKAMTVEKIAAALDEALPSEGDFSILGSSKAKITNAVVISGGGAWPELFDEFEKSEATLLITGEITHQNFHYALESGTNVLTLGHCRSETPGVIAMMNTLKQHFGIEAEFIDLPTGM